MSVTLALEWCKAQRVNCLYFLADASDLPTALIASEHGFLLVDVRVTLGHELSPNEWKFPKNICPAISSNAAGGIRPARPEDAARLGTIARGCHQDSRFYFDPNFPASRCDDLYQIWIEQGCASSNEGTFVAERDGQASGYIFCRLLNAEVGEISLVGVAPEARGHGLGQALVQRAQSWFAEKNLRRIQVVTQGRNVQAQRLYQKNGFFTREVTLWYHLWFS